MQNNSFILFKKLENKFMNEIDLINNLKIELETNNRNFRARIQFS